MQEEIQTHNHLLHLTVYKKMLKFNISLLPGVFLATAIFGKAPTLWLEPYRRRHTVVYSVTQRLDTSVFHACVAQFHISTRHPNFFHGSCLHLLNVTFQIGGSNYSH